jgi:hypothetical protein
MLPNPFKTNRPEVRDPQQSGLPEPGDYELGSLESRAAARAKADAFITLAEDQQRTLRVVVEHIGQVFDLQSSTCTRSRCPKNDTITEVVHCGRHGVIPSEELAQYIRRIPIDGKTYTLGQEANG